MRLSAFLSFLLLLCSSGTVVTGRKLRGERVIPVRRALNEEESMLFTEGLGRNKVYEKKDKQNKEYDSGDGWTSGDGGSYVAKSNNGETIYDRPPMTIEEAAPKEAKNGKDEYEKDDKEKDDKDEYEKKYKEKEDDYNEPKGTAVKSSVKKGPEYGEGASYPGTSEDATKSGGGYKIGSATKKGTNKGGGTIKNGSYKGGGTAKTGGAKKSGGAATNKQKEAAEKTKEPGSSKMGRTSAPEPIATQKVFIMSQFGLQFRIDSGSAIPQTINFAEIEAATISYLEEYLELTYGNNQMYFFDSVAIEATSRSIGGAGGPFVDFEAAVAFLEDSPMVPTNQEVGLTISEALSGSNLSTFLLTLAQSLSSDNPFLTTTEVTTYVPEEETSGQGRVAGISGGGIAAAASAVALTLGLGGFMLYKVKKENQGSTNKFGTKYSGGETLAGDTYDNTTLEATRNCRPDDTHSLGSTLYNETHSYLAHFSVGRSTLAPVDNLTSPKPSKMDDASAMTEEVLPTDADDMDDDSIPSSRSETYSIVGRAKAFVSPSKPASPMSNIQIKNYLKSKYKCASPGYYDAIGDISGNDSGEAEAPGTDLDLQSNADTVVHPILDLDLPALDHQSIVSESMAPTDEGREIFQDEMSLDSKIDSAVSDKVGATLLSHSFSLEKAEATPHAFGDAMEEDVGRSQATSSKSLDDVSLM